MIADYEQDRAETSKRLGIPDSTTSVRRGVREGGLQPARRLLAVAVRLFFELLVLGLIGLAELDTLRRRAASALVDRPARDGPS